ncbi:MAG: glucose uptake inhibitor SgrT [Ewingella sp.]|nr:glucose uptake inhibitor SgrT [Ewingella sp.]
MQGLLNRDFFQRYFRAVAPKSAPTEWLNWVPQEYRVATLTQLMQWDIDEMSDEQYRKHT